MNISSRVIISAIALTTIISFVVAVFCLRVGFYIIFQNLLYIPIIIACIHYPKKGFVFSGFVAVSYFVLIRHFTTDYYITLQALTRVGVFVVVAGVVSYLSKIRDDAVRALRSERDGFEMQVLERTAALEKNLAAEKRIEAELAESRGVLLKEREFSQLLLDASPALIVAIGFDGKTMVMNKALLDVLEFTAEEAIGTDYLTTFVPEEDRQMLSGVFRKIVADGMSMINENRIRSRSGRIYVVEWHGRPIFRKEGSPDFFIGVGIDVTERKKAEEDLARSENRYRTLVDLAVDGILLGSNDGTIIGANSCFCEMVGVGLDGLLGKNIRDVLFTSESLGKAPFRFDLLNRGETVVNERTIRRSDGTMIVVEMRTKMMPDKSYQSIYRDITDRKLSETRLEASLREKEILLRELYHRTKNNMQVIISMMSLQSALCDDRQKGFFREMTAKIKAMSIVHEKLYQSKDLSSISLREYVSDIVLLYSQIYGAKSKVSIIEKVEDVRVLIDTAIPCGLIISELLSNSFKHAFSDAGEGKIEIEMSRSGEGLMELRYRDSGPGLPADHDPAFQKNLGIKSVKALVEHQLQGKIKFAGEGGFECLVSFSGDLYRQRV